jgi:hypothetical protein
MDQLFVALVWFATFLLVLHVGVRLIDYFKR